MALEFGAPKPSEAKWPADRRRAEHRIVVSGRCAGFGWICFLPDWTAVLCTAFFLFNLNWFDKFRASCAV